MRTVPHSVYVADMPNYAIALIILCTGCASAKWTVGDVRSMCEDAPEVYYTRREEFAHRAAASEVSEQISHYRAMLDEVASARSVSGGAGGEEQAFSIGLRLVRLEKELAQEHLAAGLAKAEADALVKECMHDNPRL